MTKKPLPSPLSRRALNWRNSLDQLHVSARGLGVASIFVLGAAFAPRVSAQVVRTFTGASATPTVFDLAGNYSGGVLPSTTTGDTALFDGTVTGPLTLVYNGGFAGASPEPGIMLSLAGTQTGSFNLDSGTSATALRMGNVTIAAGAGALTFGDSTNTFNIRLGSGGGATIAYTNNSANPATVNSDVVFLLGANASHTLAVGGTGDWAFKNAINDNAGGGGAFSLTKNGTGTLTLTGSNVFTGATNVNGGTLAIGANGGLYNLGTAAGMVNVNNGGTLLFSRNDSLGGSGATSGVLVTVRGGTVANTTGFFTSITNGAFNGATITDNGGPSTGFAAFRFAGVTTVAGTTATNLNVGTATAANGINLGTINTNDSATFSVADATGDATSDFNVNDVVRNIGTATNGLIKAGFGTMTLSAANVYTGPTTVNAGTLAITGSVVSPGLILGGGTLAYAPTAAASTQAFTTTTLNAGGSSVTATAGNTLNLGAITHNAGGLVNFGGAGTITTTNAATNGILGPYAFTGTGTGLSYTTAGTVAAFTGGTAAATAAGVTDTTGIANYNVAAGGTVGAGASANTLRYTGAADTITGPVVLNGLMNAGTGALTVNGAVTAGAANELDVLSNGQNINVTGAIANNGANASALAYGGVGAGTLTLSGTNTYTGGTTIGGGVVALASGGALGTTGAITMGGGTLQYSAGNTTDYSNRFATTGGQAYNIDTNGQAVTFATALTSSAGTLNKLGAGSLTLTASATYAGQTVVNGGTLELGAGSGLYAVGTATGNITVNNGATLRFSRNDSLGGSGTISPVTVTVNGGTLASNNTYTSLTSPVFNGATIVDNGGASNGFNTFRLSGTVTVGGTATTNINTGTSTQFPGINLGSNAVTTSTTFNVGKTGSATGDLNVNVPILNSGNNASGLIKTGAGTMALNATNTYSGATVVNAGTLLVNNTPANPLSTTSSGTGTGTVTVGNIAGTAILGGTGSILGATTVNTGGTITAGSLGGTGLLTLQNSLTITTGGNFAVDLSGTMADRLTIGGVLTVGNNATLTVTGAAAVGTYILSTYASENGTFAATLPAGYSLVYGTTELDLVVAAVPEPTTWAVFGVVGLLGFARRRQIAGWLKQARC